MNFNDSKKLLESKKTKISSAKVDDQSSFQLLSLKGYTRELYQHLAMDRNEDDPIPVQERIERAVEIYRRWLANRQEMKRQLLLLADELNKHQKNVNIAQATGAGTSIVGTGLAIGGFVASFFTFGASLIVTVVGAGVGGAGGLSVAGSGIVHYILNRKIYKKAQIAIDQDQALTSELTTAVDDIGEEGLEFLQYAADVGTSTTWENVCLALDVSRWAKIIAKNIIADSIKMAGMLRIGAKVADAATDGGAVAFKAMGGVVRGFHIAGFAVGVLLLPLDIYTLVKSSVSLHKGNTSEAENKIRGIVENMHCPDELHE